MKRMITLLSITIVMASCTKTSVVGDGPVITETRSLPGFTSVRLEGSVHANIVKGTTTSVQVAGYQNLVSLYESEVQNGVLVLKLKDGLFNVRNNNLSVNVVVPSLRSASTHGSGDINFSGFIGQEFNGDINGSGSLYATNCDYQRANLQVNGSGSVYARDLVAGSTSARINGSGKIETTTLINLTVRITGSGNVYYWGAPGLEDFQVSGSGRIFKK